MLIEIILVIITIIILDYFIKKELNDKTKDIPGPYSLPIIGGALAFIKRRPENVLEHSVECKNNYGRLFKVWLFNRLFIFVSNPNDLEVILSSPKYINKGSLYGLLNIWLGDGLLLSSGAKWHSRRKIITPTFHFKILEQFVEVFDQQSSILIDKLREHSKAGGPVNIQPIICLETLDIITETAMGTKVHCQTESDNEYVNAVADITYVMALRFTNIWYRFEWIFSIFRSDLKIKQNNAIKTMHSFTENIIIKRRAALENSLKNETKKEDEDINSKKRMALLDILLQSTTTNGTPLSNEDIREEVDTFVFEGHDTTASAICSALYELSKNPKIQLKAFEEIQQVIGTDKNHKIELRELQDLKYLECIIKEALRLYPPVPSFTRRLAEDCKLNGKILPSNANVVVQAYAMQKDEKYFPEANKFLPERYLTENVNDKRSFANIPFSAGPRNCIGQKFAMFEMKVTLLKIIQNFELLPLGPEVKLISTLILRSSNGVHLGLKER